MSKRRPRRPVRHRVGRVSFYSHHGAWWVYYREGQRPVRRRIGESQQEAEQVAAQINAQLSSASPSLLSFTPIAVPALRERFLDHHETVLRSSVATIRRYRAATQHLIDFVAESGAGLQAHEVSAEQFAAFLRARQIAPNGHPNTTRRRLRDKGVRFILEVCRSMYGYAERMRHLPPYAANPFRQLRLERMRVDDAKPVFVFSAAAELAFLEAADDWEFPIHFTLAKTGLRPGELTHLLIEDLDLAQGWLHIRNKKELGWRIKTGTERTVPVIQELATILSRLIAERDCGPVFVRRRYVSGECPLLCLDRSGLRTAYAQRLAEYEEQLGRGLSREERLRVARTVWRDAGAIKADQIRSSFVRIARRIGLTDATCPKSWRHTFATLLQDGNVDPLIRQITLGHKVTGGQGPLGMTGVYTHTRPETQRQQLEAALRQWPPSLRLARQRLHAGGGGVQ